MEKIFLTLGLLCALIYAIAAFPFESGIPLSVQEKNEDSLLLRASDEIEEQPISLDVVDFDQSNNGETRKDEMNGSRTRRTILLKKAAILKLGLLKAGVLGLGAAKIAGLGLAGSALYNSGYKNYGSKGYGGYNGYSGYNSYGGYDGYNKVYSSHYTGANRPYGYLVPYGRKSFGAASYEYY